MTTEKPFQQLQADEVERLETLLRQYQEMDTCNWLTQVQDAMKPALQPLQHWWQQETLGKSQKAALCYVVLSAQIQEKRRTSFIEAARWWYYVDHFAQITGETQGYKTRNALVRSLYHANYVTRLDRLTHHFSFKSFALKIFGETAWQKGYATITHTLTNIGYENIPARAAFDTALAILLLVQRSADIERVDSHLLYTLYAENPITARSRHFQRIALALHTLEYGNYARCFQHTHRSSAPSTLTDHIAPDWVAMADRWLQTSVLAPNSRKRIYRTVLQIGRWLAATHPDIQHPEHWTRQTALDCVQMVSHLHCYQWSSQPAKQGKPLKPSSKQKVLDAMRSYFTDIQSWQWIGQRFNPQRALATPTHILNDVHPQPRVIQADVWAKLLSAALELEQADLKDFLHRKGGQQPLFHPYPIEMVRAVALTWLFSGLRKNEISRLRVGCIRWQAVDPDTDENAAHICLLHYPANKTGPASLKPVDAIVGEAIEVWESLRPPQAAVMDAKSREKVDWLFMYRGRGLGKHYINQSLIPLLCHKADMPQADSRGAITSHRARSTIATQLANAEQGMSLTDLQQWLGHKTAESTQYYLEMNPHTLTKAYLDAGYFERNLRSIRVLVDQSALQTGNGLLEDRWLYYDLGHGYCSYSFFQRCPHRMVCKQCSYYLPKASHLAQMLEARDHLLEAHETIELTAPEQEAVETDLTRLKTWIDRLQSIPTPDMSTAGFVALDDVT